MKKPSNKTSWREKKALKDSGIHRGKTSKI